jgi:hypothetical protein
MKSVKIQDASGWSIFIFGALALLLGLFGLLFPNDLLALLGFTQLEPAQRGPGDYTLLFVIASSMASINVGAYYVLAALNDVKKFFLWTVPFRSLTFCVFTGAVLLGLAPGPFVGIGVWELTGAVATGTALYFENRASKGKA